MARFAVHAEPDGDGFLLDVQADAMEHLNTRVMVTQFIAAVPRRILKQSAFSLAQQRGEIIAAIDLLFQGF